MAMALCSSEYCFKHYASVEKWGARDPVRTCFAVVARTTVMMKSVLSSELEG